jgi:perosamine synthetase
MSKNFIPVARPLLGDEEVAAAARAIRSGWVTQGPEVAAFEHEFADFVGSRYACAVSSCTTALHLALLAVGVRPGDEVITVSHSFIATANSIRYCGATPVFVDIDPATFNIDPRKVEAAIGERARAILCVHQMGMPCDLSTILPIADKHRIPVVEDAACAIGSEILWQGQWEKVGKPHGDVACFSFHPRKLLTTGDGGTLTTNDAETDRKFRLWRQHGMSVPDTVRHSSREVVFESYPELGFNYRMTDIQAAIGREQLKRLPEAIAERRALADRYRELLADIPGLILPAEPEWARSNWQSFCVRLPENINQREAMQNMLDDGVATRRGIMCAHLEPAYAAPGTWRCSQTECKPGGTCPNLIESERAQNACAILPLFSQMTEEQQERVASALHQACVAASVR